MVFRVELLFVYHPVSLSAALCRIWPVELSFTIQRNFKIPLHMDHTSTLTAVCTIIVSSSTFLSFPVVHVLKRNCRPTYVTQASYTNCLCNNDTNNNKQWSRILLYLSDFWRLCCERQQPLLPVNEPQSPPQDRRNKISVAKMAGLLRVAIHSTLKLCWNTYSEARVQTCSWTRSLWQKVSRDYFLK